jgi:hypothetical protein
MAVIWNGRNRFFQVQFDQETSPNLWVFCDEHVRSEQAFDQLAVRKFFLKQTEQEGTEDKIFKLLIDKMAKATPELAQGI